MNFTTTKRLLIINIKNISNIEKLQKLKVQLIDAWHQSKATYGMSEAVKNGFYKIVGDTSASGYYPSDIWLKNSLENRLETIHAQEIKLLNCK